MVDLSNLLYLILHGGVQSSGSGIDTDFLFISLVLSPMVLAAQAWLQMMGILIAVHLSNKPLTWKELSFPSQYKAK